MHQINQYPNGMIEVDTTEDGVYILPVEYVLGFKLIRHQEAVPGSPPLGIQLLPMRYAYELLVRDGGGQTTTLQISYETGQAILFQNFKPVPKP